MWIRVRIRIDLAPGSRSKGIDEINNISKRLRMDPHWIRIWTHIEVKSWIRIQIRTETNEDPHNNEGNIFINKNPQINHSTPAHSILM